MKKSHHGIRTAVILLVIIAAGFLAWSGPLQNIRDQAAISIFKSQLVSQAADAAGLSEEQVEDIIQVIPEDQQKELVNIVLNHLNPSSVLKVTNLAKEGDNDEIASFIEDELSEQEKEEAEEIVYSNQDALINKLSQYGITVKGLE